MRVAVVGKGGAGKSVIAGTMARVMARRGARVLALDSDPLPGLSLSLGSGSEPAGSLLSEAAVRDENGHWGWRKGVGPVRAVQRYSNGAPNGVRLVQIEKAQREQSESFIGASKAFWEVVHHIADARALRDWTFIGDLPAGPRHVAYDYAPYAHTYVVVVQPTAQSALTARRVARIVRMHRRDTEVVFVANRVTEKGDVRRVEKMIGEPTFTSLPADDGVAAAERLGVAPIDHAPDSPAIAAIERLVSALAKL